MKNIRFTSLLLVITGGALWLAARKTQAPQGGAPARPVEPLAAAPAVPVAPAAEADANGPGKRSWHGLIRAMDRPSTTPYRTRLR